MNRDPAATLRKVNNILKILQQGEKDVPSRQFQSQKENFNKSSNQNS
jgi:hypothetical protein